MTSTPAGYRGEYVARLNRVMDHIQDNIDQDLSLAALAKVACFSPYHFHRIFSAMLGETCRQFTNRVRVERAANKLLVNKSTPITEVALDCGFSSLETFARSFKERFGMTATEWRERVEGPDSKNCKTFSKNGQELRKRWQAVNVGVPHHDPNNNTMSWRIEMKRDGEPLECKVEVQDLPAMDVAYVRHIGPYKGDEQLFAGLFGRLMTWAGPRGLLGPDTKALILYHDDPNVTDEQKLRTSVCVSCQKDTEVSGEIGKLEVAAGKYAVARFEIDATEYEAAWNAVYGQWLPESGYQCGDAPPFERCINNPEDHPEGKHIVDICIPVKPL